MMKWIGQFNGHFPVSSTGRPSSNLDPTWGERFNKLCLECHVGSAHQGSCDQILHIAGDSREDLIVFSNAASDVNTYLYNYIYTCIYSTSFYLSSISSDICLYLSISVCPGTLAPAAFAFSSASCLVIWSISPVNTMVTPAQVTTDASEPWRTDVNRSKAPCKGSPGFPLTSKFENVRSTSGQGTLW